MQIRRARFAQAWILHDSARYAWMTWVAGIPVRLGYGFDTPRWLLTCGRLLTEGERGLHPLAKASRLLDLLVVPHTPTPRLAVDQVAAQAIARGLGGRPEPWVALGVGSSEPAKQWGAGRFAELARMLASTEVGSIWVVGGDAERALAREVVVQAGVARVEDAVDLPLDETAALLSRCRIYVGNDTGLLNMAAALGVPSVGLFGASQPPARSPLIHAVTPSPSRTGMNEIGVARVVNAVRALLNVEFEEST